MPQRSLPHHFLLLRGLAVLLLVPAANARAEPLPTQGAVLTPDVAPQVEAAFRRAEPSFHLQDAKIRPQRVDARVCRPAGDCLDLVLTQPSATCPGTALTTWCVQFPTGAPPDVAVLLRALETRSPWSAPPVRQGPRNGNEPPTLSWLALLAGFFAPLLAFVLLLHWARTRWLTRWPRERVWLLALVFALFDAAWHIGAAAQGSVWGLSTAIWLGIWWLVPVCAGGTVGLVFRWGLGKRPTSRWTLWLPLLILPLFGAIAAVWSRRIGAMDGAALAFVATLTWLAVAHQRCARLAPWLVSLASLTAGLLLLEVAARFVLPPPPVIEWHELSLLNHNSPRPDGLPVGAGDLLIDCALHAEVGEETARCLRLGPPPKDRPWVLHLGDSMLFGSGVAPESALPAQLAKLRPEVAQLNAGVPGTSIDVELALLQRVLRLGRPAMVVLYAMPGNDADEVATPAESCNAQPPVKLVGQAAHETPELRCPRAVWAPRPWYAAFLHSRLPLPIAALTNASWLARHLEWLHRLAIEAPRAHEREPPPDAKQYGRYFHALVTLLRDEGIPLRVVVMPLRRSQYIRFTDARRRQLQAVLRVEGVPIIDTQTPADQLVQRQGEAALYVDEPPGDIHLNAHGLAQLAEYLGPQLALPKSPTPTQ